MKKSLVITITIFLLLPCVFSQTRTKELGFFAPIYNTKDEGTAKLIVDLYYNHLLSFDSFRVQDFRSTVFSQDTVLNNYGIQVAFFIDISDKNNNWTIAFTAFFDNKTHTEEKIYDSYYQVLLSAKNDLFVFLDRLEKTEENTAREKSDDVSATTVSINLDSIAGTWFTDASIDKIIILRGGRGFVIYKNGASMNISVEIRGNQIIALQTSKTNASFFPELPRDLALKVATEELQPIKWIMTAKNENEMVGEKNHYEAVYENEKATSVKTVSSPSRWTR
ncbi:MAG TPA: hypothetical protein VLZ44_00925 [Treponemataceae bacterium]|nr:hypothetical protein [Treponemataceae bacterium]